MNASAPEHLHWRAGWLGVGLFGVALVIYLSLVPDHPPDLGFAYADKFEHVAAYGVLAYWWMQLYPQSPRRWLIAALLIALGVSMEYAQAWGGSRMFDPQDMVANGTGVVLAWGLAWLSGDALLRRVEQVLRWGRS